MPEFISVSPFLNRPRKRGIQTTTCTAQNWGCPNLGHHPHLQSSPTIFLLLVYLPLLISPLQPPVSCSKAALNRLLGLLELHNASSGCRDKRSWQSLPLNPLEEEGHERRASQLGEPVCSLGFRNLSAASAGCGTGSGSLLVALSRLLPPMAPRWKPSQHSDVTWGPTHCSQEPWSQALRNRGTQQPDIQSYTQAGLSRRMLGKGSQTKALRAGLTALHTQKSNLFLPLNPAAIGVKHTTTWGVGGREGRSAELLRGQTRAQHCHGQSAECQARPGPVAHCCSYFNYVVGAEVPVWPRNCCFLQSSCLR